MQKIILHIDFDSFFASVEQQDNPLFRNRPICVTATNGRTCIIAASREAKAAGIKSPSRTHDAKKICPSIIFVPAHFTRYWEISKKFINICKDYTPYVEVFSLDEVFMDITSTAYLFGGTEKIINNIRTRLIEEVGEYITVSVGISHNKLLAKLASGLKKPNGLVQITPDNLNEIYDEAELTDICGIGRRIEVRLHEMGIYTLRQLAAAPLSALVAEFGNVEGKFLKNIGQGIDDSPIIPYTDTPEVKSVGRNYCLPQNEYDHRTVMQNVYELCEEVGIKLRRLGMKARTIGISLRGDENIFERKTFSSYVNSGKDIFEACAFLLRDKSDYLSYVRQIGIWVSHLHALSAIPLPLLPEDRKWQTITTVIDSINDKFGDHTIRTGFLLYADKLTTVPNGYMADKYERTKFAKEQTELFS